MNDRVGVVCGKPALVGAQASRVFQEALICPLIFPRLLLSASSPMFSKLLMAASALLPVGIGGLGIFAAAVQSRPTWRGCWGGA